MAVKRYVAHKTTEGEPVFFLTSIHKDHPEILQFTLSTDKKLATPFGTSNHAQTLIGTLRAPFLEEVYVDLDIEGPVEQKNIERKPNEFSWPENDHRRYPE
jgi:hypothetical protein